MRRASLLLLCCLLSACRTSSLGSCASDTDCKRSGSRCDTTQSPPVCVVPQGDCFPACQNGKGCQAGSCVSLICDPPCDLTHVCSQATLTCVDLTAPQIFISSPATNGYATGSSLQVTVSARAPGGVTAVQLQLSTQAGALLASAAAVATPTSADPGNWAGTLSLNNLADGPAQLVATATYGAKAQTAASDPIQLTLDTHAPVITLITDGSSHIYAGGQTAQIGATISDGAGSGVALASVVLILEGGTHAPFPGTSAGGRYNFAVPIDDSVLAAGNSATFKFRLAAKDKAGNSAELSGLPGELLRADRDAPLIAQISIATPADYVDLSSGRRYYLNDAGPLSITAEITDFAGVDPAAVCLHASGEDAGCAHLGISADGGFWSFTLPRPATSAQDDGSLPTQLSISAQDKLVPLIDAGVAEHQSKSFAGAVYFDNLGPSIQVASDPAPYARAAANVLTVQATINAPVGIGGGTPRLVSKGVSQGPFATADGGIYLFQLKTTDAPSGAEGPYTFDITAQDNLGHSADRPATRFVDDAPPALSLKIYSGSVEPAAAGVTYPAAVASTGWTGSLFIYNDVVHVKGTLSDQGGLTGAAANLHLDGTGIDGGVVLGIKIGLGCTDGQTTCNFNLPVALNAPGNGPFNTGGNVTGLDSNGNLLPTGPLTFTIEAQDRAESADGGPAHNPGNTAAPVNATRFWWQANLGSTVTGLAIHPDGDLIATTLATSATSDTVYALYLEGAAPGLALDPTASALHWSAGADAGIAVGPAKVSLGAIPDQPAIGKGDAAGAPIYLATANAAIAALNPNGSIRWHADKLDVFSVGPAVGSATIAGTGAVEQLFVPSNKAGGQQHLWAAYQGAVPTKLNIANGDPTSSPILLNGFVWFGDSGGITQVSYGNGMLGNTAVHDTAVTGPYFDLITDGTNLFGATTSLANNQVLRAFGQNFAPHWPNNGTDPNITPNQSPILGTQGLLISDTANNVNLLNPANDTLLGSFNPGANANVPLQGAGGRVFVPRNQAQLYTYEQDGTLAWFFDPPGTIFRGLQLDCAGHLFLATDSTVYALISDDLGLANSAWPNYRRDGRNTGDASALKYGINNAGSCAP